MSAVVAQAARDLASELDRIGTTQFDSIAKAFRHFADFVDGREPSPGELGDTRRDRAREAVSQKLGEYVEEQGWTVLPSRTLWPELIDEIIDAVDLA